MLNMKRWQTVSLPEKDKGDTWGVPELCERLRFCSLKSVVHRVGVLMVRIFSPPGCGKLWRGVVTQSCT